MQVAELKARKAVAESTIREAVAAFVADTGLPVSSVSIDMLDVTTRGGPKEFIVGKVDIEFEL